MEDERPRWEDELTKYREIINRQKTEIGRQREKLEEVTKLEEQQQRYMFAVINTHAHTQSREINKAPELFSQAFVGHELGNMCTFTQNIKPVINV